MKFLSVLFFLAFAITGIYAQNQRIIHQTFQLDTATTLQLDLFGTFTIEPWVGDAIMIETQISVLNASEGALNHYIKEGRYEIEPKLEGTTLLLTSKTKKRPQLKKADGTSAEQVVVKVFMPDGLQAADANTWTKPKE